MKYDPDIHRRRSIRLRGYDYSQAGLYFVTICCNERKCRFGDIENDQMILNEYGITAHNEWLNLPGRFAQVELDVFQIMPNHMHGIIVIGGAQNAGAQNTDDPGRVGAPLAGALIRAGAENRAGASPAPTGAQNAGAQTTGVTALGDIVGAYKSLVANACLKIYQSNHQTMGKFWQRNYWEHIVRDEGELSRIRHYIETNPLQWATDKLNGGSGNRVLEAQASYGGEPWMV